MRVGLDDLNRTAFGLAYGSVIGSGHSAIIGGFSGTPEGGAIVAVAGGLQSRVVNGGHTIGPRAAPFRIRSRATRDHLWIAGLALAAINRNTHLVLEGGMGDHPAAGPGTRQFFLESAAGHIASTVMGGHSMGGTRKFVIGDVPDFGSPLESRWMGEVCKGATGMTRPEANRAILRLAEKYEPHLKDAPYGRVFSELYDTEAVEPQPWYCEIYEECRAELEEMGVRFREY